MSVSKQLKIAAVMAYHQRILRLDEYEWMRWTKKRRRLSLAKANAHFVGVMLDQGQLAERAWDAGRHLVANHFLGKQGFWREVLRAHPQTVRRICTTGYEGQSYATRYSTNKFPKWLRSAAYRMVSTYDGDPRRIWAVAPEHVASIYDRMRDFDGIGDALAKMGQFIVVRNYGAAGGRKSQHLMSIKPDILVRRILFRMGITSSENIATTVAEVAALHLRRPADFDAALWNAGREYCFNTSPACDKCPLSTACTYAQA